MNETPNLLPLPNRKLVDATTVSRLIAAQFPQWSSYAVRPIDAQGWDNCTFRLGSDMSVRMPTSEEYALAVEKEHRWLPVLAPGLPFAIPVPLAKGVPGENYFHDWSIYRWLDGESAHSGAVDDMTAFAIDLAKFLESLQQIDSTGGPGPGLHNWFRGGPLATYDAWVQTSLLTLDGLIQADIATEIWERALLATWDNRPIWFHGDIASGNLLVQDGVLTSVIDFGTCGIGDPACDMAIAWTMFTGVSRAAFRARLGVDEATWERGRGWALWKALVGCAGAVRRGEALPTDALFVLDEIITDYDQAA